MARAFQSGAFQTTGFQSGPTFVVVPPVPAPGINETFFVRPRPVRLRTAPRNIKIANPVRLRGSPPRIDV